MSHLSRATADFGWPMEVRRVRNIIALRGNIIAPAGVYVFGDVKGQGSNDFLFSLI